MSLWSRGPLLAQKLVAASTDLDTRIRSIYSVKTSREDNQICKVAFAIRGLDPGGRHGCYWTFFQVHGEHVLLVKALIV